MLENSTLSCPEGGKWAQVILRQWKTRLLYLFHEAFPLTQAHSDGSLLGNPVTSLSVRLRDI